MSKEEEIDIVEYYSVIRKRIRLVLTVFSLFIFLAIIYSFTTAKIYTADASIHPSFEEEQAPNLGALGGLASNFGLPNLQSKSTSDLYPEILKSRPVIHTLLKTEVENPETGKRELILDLLNIPGSTLEKRLEKGYKKFLKRMDTAVNTKTGIVIIAVETDKNWLSKVILDELLDLLIQYNKETRTSKARNNRVFIEKQLEKFERSFTIAEQKLTEHEKKNRSFEDSPGLKQERRRLQLEYEICQTNYINFKNEFETAVLQEVKDTPVLNILNTPIIPQYKSSPKRLLIVVISGIVGLSLGILGAFLIEYTEKRKLNSEAVA
ncbi:Wzz/FepE/Etk N-terminal domain-containing protein [candidate division KSB1 bacterium]